LKRDEGLVIVELPEETLVYDRQHTQAHCLNRTAAAVWRACDGRTGTDEIAAQAARTLDAHVSLEMVDGALDRLDRAHLLAAGSSLRAEDQSSRAKLTRRAIVAGVAVALAPVVISMLAPKPAAAATSMPVG